MNLLKKKRPAYRNQIERLLDELDNNIKAIDMGGSYDLLQLQAKLVNLYSYPKYCLNVRKDMKRYFKTAYSFYIQRIIEGTNTGIPAKDVIAIMEKAKSIKPKLIDEAPTMIKNKERAEQFQNIYTQTRKSEHLKVK